MSSQQAVRVSDRAGKLLSDAFVWDMTLPWEADAVDETTLPRFKAAGVDLISLTVNMPTFDATIRHVAAVLADIRAHADTMTLIRTVDDALEARSAGKLALTLNLQETNPLDGEVAMVEVFYQLGYEDDFGERAKVVYRRHEVLYENFEAGKNTLVLIDEGQLMQDQAVLEELRLVLNYQLNEAFLVSLRIVGQPRW